MKHIACPIALHPEGAPLRILTLTQEGQHRPYYPNTPVPRGAFPAQIAAQYLFAQTGLETIATLSLGEDQELQTKVIWHFTMCRIKPPVLPTWHHIAVPNGNRVTCTWSSPNTRSTNPIDRWIAAQF